LTTHKTILENISIDSTCIRGTILLINLCYEKTVFVRWTTNNWTTHKDTLCTYCNSSTNTTDRFSFALPLNDSKLELAICYRALNIEYWDNNDSHNYIILVHNNQLN
jgi:protein phosphatase 1 regulatory subunit 3A/B/C/D/E